MNNYINKLKNNKGYFATLIFILIFTILIDIPFLVNKYIQKKYPMIEISNEQFLKNDKNLKDFENKDGILHSLSDDPWVTYYPKEVTLDNIKTVEINVKHLSSEVMASQIFILDSYKCIYYDIKEGNNIIIIPNNISDGKQIKGLRFDLLVENNKEIEIDNIILNNNDLMKDIFVKQVREIAAKVILLLLLCITPLLTFKLGLNKIGVNKRGVILGIVSIFTTIILQNFNYNNTIVYFVFINIFALLTGIYVYSLTTKVILNIHREINNKLKISKQVCLTIIFMVCCFTIYFNIKSLFIYLALYPFYLFGFVYNEFEIIEYKNTILIKTIILSAVVILSKFIFDLHNISMLYTNFDKSNIKLSIIAMISISWLIGFSFLSMKNIRIMIEKKKVFKIIPIYLFFIVFLSSIIFYTKIYGIIYLSIFLVMFFILKKEINITFYGDEYSESEKENNLIKANLGKKVISILINISLILVIALSFEILIQYYLNKVNASEIVGFIYQYIFTPKGQYNILLVTIIYYLFIFIFGNNLGKVCISITVMIMMIGNFIKLKYHNSLLKPADFFQIKSLIEISKSFLSSYLIVSLTLIIIILIIFIIKFRKKLILLLKPRPKIIMIILMIICLIFFVNSLEKGKFEDVYIYSNEQWVGDNNRIQNQGFFIYNYINIKNINQIKVQKPKGYNEQRMNELKREFKILSNNKGDNDIKPNVILIMEESMFDIQKINEIEFSKDINSTIKKYQKSTTISPTYGGGTASVEFEALTGLSNLFFTDGIVPYVTYWNGKNYDIPSIAKEFNKNGYNTTAIHPNKANFYNRNLIYNAMGFDKFLSIEDFSDYKSTNTRGFILDSEVKNVIDKQLNSTDDPQFIFGITIEGHGPYNSKELESDIKVSSDKLSDSQIYEAEAYSQSLSSANNFIKEIIETVKNTNKPTIVYFWGDHLPSLSAFEKLGFLNNVYNKYSTPLVTYSNFKDISIDSEYITPNQIAPQILNDAGISYNNYFDYIYSLREKYPVLHKEFGVDMDNEMVKKYELLQYDLLFGEKYILNEE